MPMQWPEQQKNQEIVDKNPEFWHLTQAEDVDADLFASLGFEETPDWQEYDINHKEEETKDRDEKNMDPYA